MKKIIAILLLTVLLMPTAAVYADSWEQDITVTYNGELIPFNIEPQIMGGRTMVPFRAVFEKLGGTVSFDGATRTVSSERDGKTVSFVIGEYEATVKSEKGEEKIAIDTAPIIVNDYTLVPVRFVAEASGMKVNWDDFYREVVIIDTSVWKKEIEEKSAFLDLLMDMPLNNSAAGTAVETNEEVELDFSFALKNMGELYNVTGKGPENINFSLSLKVVSNEYFDGENAKADSNLVIDLSAFNKFLKEISEGSLTAEDEAMADTVFKKHNLNLEIIVDKNYNIYINTKDYAEILKSFGVEDVAVAEAEDYIKIPYPIENTVSVQSAQNLWELVDKAIYADDTLTTETVKMLDMMFGMCADLYSDDYVKLETKSDGEVKITLNITKEAYMAAMDNMISSMWQYDELDGLDEDEKAYVEAEMQEMRDIFGAMDYSITGTIEMKDFGGQSADIRAIMKMTDFLVPDTENIRMDLNFEVSAKADSKKSLNAEKVEIPESFVDITE